MALVLATHVIWGGSCESCRGQGRNWGQFWCHQECLDVSTNLTWGGMISYDYGANRCRQGPLGIGGYREVLCILSQDLSAILSNSVTQRLSRLSLSQPLSQVLGHQTSTRSKSCSSEDALGTGEEWYWQIPTDGMRSTFQSLKISDTWSFIAQFMETNRIHFALTVHWVHRVHLCIKHAARAWMQRPGSENV